MEETKNQNEAKIDWVEEIFDWGESILFALFSVTLLFTFVFRLAIVDGSSMIPTLHNNDRLVLFNHFYEPKPRDIIVLDSKGLNEAIVKRVIATEGQEVNIDFDQGKVYVDGTEQEEPYINELTYRDGGAFDYPVTVPKDCVFVMGDNRNNSTDSRYPQVGFVEKDTIVGHVIFRIFPFNAFGVPQ